MKSFEFVDEEKSFKFTEACKALRTNISFCGDDIKTIAFTSCIPGEGKSFVSWNTSIEMAQTGKRILYIDADLRKSNMVGRLKVGESVLGLSHFLSGQAELSDVIYLSNNKNLSVIFAGSFPPGPAELLGNSKFKMLITKLRESFDYIIIDTPPLGTVIDAAVIAPVCDGAIIVVSVGSVSHKLAKNVKEQLEKSNCKILGTVLNKINHKESGGYYNKYYSYSTDYS